MNLQDHMEARHLTLGTTCYVRDAFDHWLAASPAQANQLLDWVADRAEERLRQIQQGQQTPPPSTPPSITPPTP